MSRSRPPSYLYVLRRQRWGRASPARLLLYAAILGGGFAAGGAGFCEFFEIPWTWKGAVTFGHLIAVCAALSGVWDSAEKERQHGRLGRMCNSALSQREVFAALLLGQSLVGLLAAALTGVALAVLEWQDSGSLGRWLVLEGLLGTGLVFTALFAVGLQQPGRSEPRRGIVLLLVIVVLWAAVLILGDMRQSLDVPDALLQPWPPLLLALAGLSLLLLSIGSGGLAYARLRGRPVRRWTAAILVTGLLPALTAGALLMPRMGQESPPHTALSLAFGLALVVGSLPFASASNGRLTPGVAGPVCRGVLFYLAALGCLFAAAVSPQRFADSSAAFGLLAFAGTGCLRLTAYLAVLDWLRRRWPALAPALFWSLYTAVEMSVSLFGTTPPTLAEDWQPLGALDAFSRACSALEQSQHLTHDLGWSLGGVPASSESEAFFIPLLLTAAAALLALLLPRLRRVRPATAAPAAVRLPRRARPAPADWRGTLSRLSPLLAALARQEARWLSSAHPSFCSACFSGH